MKNLFLALLLANLLFLGWRTWIAPPDVDPLRLAASAREPEVAPAEVADTAASAARAPAAGSGCVRLGPISDGQVADTLRARLAGNGIANAMTTEEGQVWVGHWVQIESVPSREEADQMVARLVQGGLPDAYVLQASPPFSISLGVFRDRARADAVTATATSLGFQPQVTDRYRAGLQYWLTFAMPADQPMPLDELVRESGQILRTEQVACPDGSIGAPRPIN